jgi:hypothetical protein
MKKTIDAIVKEDLDEIGPVIGLHIEIPVEGFKEGDLVTVTYSVSKAKDVEVDDSMYLRNDRNPITVDDCMDFFIRHKMHKTHKTT